MLEVDRIHSGYGNVPVLRDISLSVQPGEIVLVVGENGAGKSTLLRTIAGFIKPDRGTIKLAGADVSASSPEDLVRDGLRLILDGHRVFPEISVYDNLRLGNAFRKFDKPAFDKAVDSILTVFPILKDKIKDYARDLSGGQQQMLALGQAFVAQPKVLLCDEPSTGLAQALLPPILQFLKSWAQQGAAIVIVEQHMEIALPVADRVILIERGEARINCAAKDFKPELAKHLAGKVAA